MTQVASNTVGRVEYISGETTHASTEAIYIAIVAIKWNAVYCHLLNGHTN